MKKNKLKIIEAYIYAKTLNLISSGNSSPATKQIAEVINDANILSKNLLSACETKIKQNKLDDISFFVLKQQLECIDTSKGTTTNYLKICEMIKNYNKYLKIATN